MHTNDIIYELTEVSMANAF